MDKTQRSDAGSTQNTSLDRFDIPIGILAISLYVIERWIAFAWLQSRPGALSGWEAQALEFFFGRPPYSILDILLGFDVPESLLGLLHPKNIAQAGLQALHFLINWSLAGLPFRLYQLLNKRNPEPE